MRHSTLTALLIGLLPSCVVAQTVNLDSLFKVWRDTSRSDTDRLKAVTDISWKGYLRQQPDSAFYYADQEILFATRTGQRAYAARALNIKGEVMRRRSEYERAREYYQQSIDVALSAGYKKGVAQSLNNIGLSYYQQAESDTALAYLARSMKVYEDNGDFQGVAGVLNNMGNIHIDRGEYAQAVVFYRKSLGYKEKVGDQLGYAGSLCNIGDVYLEQGDYARALVDFRRALDSFTRLDEKDGAATALQGIGTALYHQGDVTAAIDYYAQSLRLREQVGFKPGIAASLGAIGSIHQEIGNVEEAISYYQRSSAIQAEIGDKKGMASSLSHLGRFFIQSGDSLRGMEYLRRSFEMREAMGDRLGAAHSLEYIANAYRIQRENALSLQNHLRSLRIREEIGDRLGVGTSLNNMAEIHFDDGNYIRAVGDAKKALEIGRSLGSVQLVRDAAQVLYKSYKKSGEWGDALKMHEVYLTMRDSIANEANSKAVLRQHMRYEYGRKAAADSAAAVLAMNQIELERAKEIIRADRNRNAALAVGGAGIFFLSAGMLFYRQDRRRRRERYERNAALLQTRVLRTQMNPHFIFNALNSINSYVQENERDLASGFLTKFARLMRLVLENSRHEEVPLTQDLEALRLYMDLEQARMNNRFRYEVDIDPAIDEEATLVPPLVLQPFVENAIWHGLSRKDAVGLLRLSVRQRDGALLMIVEDDGVGRKSVDGSTDPAAPPKTSMGTGITQERLTMLGKQRGGEAGFRYVDVQQGTRVEVSMPVTAMAGL